MSLGYSLGDFIAGANMTYRLIRALSETKGACMEYQEAMSELGALQQTFLQVGYLRPSPTLCQATINAAAYIVLSSVELIGDFLRKTEKYRQRLGRVRKGHAVSDSWQKMGWVLFKREELKDLKDKLHLKLTNIGVLLSTAQIHGDIPFAVAQFKEQTREAPGYIEVDKKVQITVESVEQTQKVPNSSRNHLQTPDGIPQFEDKRSRSRSPSATYLSTTQEQSTSNPQCVDKAIEGSRAGPDMRTSSSLIPLTEASTQVRDEPLKLPSATNEQGTKIESPIIIGFPITGNKTAQLRKTSSFELNKDEAKISENSQALKSSMKQSSGGPSLAKAPVSSSELKQSKAITTYEEVNGKWVLPKTVGIDMPKEALQGDFQPKILENGISSENVTKHQSTLLTEPLLNYAETPLRAEADDIYGFTNTQSKSAKTALSGGQLLSQIETFLRETGNIRTVKAIKFKDAVGRKFTFPWEQASTWKGMEDLIRQAFANVEGLGPHVLAGKYDLIGPNGEIILPKVWDTTIEPDWSISMHMWPMPDPAKSPQRSRGAPSSYFHARPHSRHASVLSGPLPSDSLGPPPPPPANWRGGPPPRPMTGGGAGGGIPGGGPVIVNLTRKSPSIRSNSRHGRGRGPLAWMASPRRARSRSSSTLSSRNGRSSGVLAWIAGPRRARSPSPSRTKVQDWMKRANKLLTMKKKDEDSDTDDSSIRRYRTVKSSGKRR